MSAVVPRAIPVILSAIPVILSEAKDLSHGIIRSVASVSRDYWVYILSSRTRATYVGVTNDLPRRLLEHRQGTASAFTRRYRINRLVYAESTGDVQTALVREKQIKGWIRAKKVALVESMNPSWRDLGTEILPERDPSLRSG